MAQHRYLAIVEIEVAGNSSIECAHDMWNYLEDKLTCVRYDSDSEQVCQVKTVVKYNDRADRQEGIDATIYNENYK